MVFRHRGVFDLVFYEVSCVRVPEKQQKHAVSRHQGVSDPVFFTRFPASGCKKNRQNMRFRATGVSPTPCFTRFPASGCQDRSKTGPRRPKDGPRRPEECPRWLKMAQDGSQMALNCFPTASEVSKKPQDGPNKAPGDSFGETSGLKITAKLKVFQ